MKIGYYKKLLKQRKINYTSSKLLEPVKLLWTEGGGGVVKFKLEFNLKDVLSGTVLLYYASYNYYGFKWNRQQSEATVPLKLQITRWQFKTIYIYDSTGLLLT